MRRRPIYQKNPDRWVPEQRRFWRYQIDPRTYRLSASPEVWGLPITVSFQERNLEGHCHQIAEGGLGALLSEELPVGSVVSLHFVVPPSTKLRIQAVVRYRLDFQHGLVFTAPTEGERIAIRRFCKELPRLPDERLRAARKYS